MNEPATQPRPTIPNSAEPATPRSDDAAEPRGEGGNVVQFPGAAPKSPVKWLDATVHGDLDQDLLAEEVEISMSNSGKETFRGGWTTEKMTVKELLESLAQHPVGQKDGSCYLQGAVVGGVRSSAATKHADLLVLDLDQGEALASIHEKVRKLGKLCVVYTTHSFGKCVSPIKRDALVKFTGGDGDVDPTLDEAVNYLLSVKGYEPSVLGGAELLETEHLTEGVTMRVKHQPMPKARLVFVLEKRFSFSVGGTQKDLISLWKERYAGTARTLGVAIDRSCTDPSRLFYSPRHAKGAKFQVDIFAGDFLDLEQMPRVTSQDLRDENPFTKAAKAMGAGNDYQTESLLWFFGKHGTNFDLADFLLETDPDGDRGSRATGPGRTHRCPNDDNHSDAGNPEDKGFFCVNALDSEAGQAVAKCMHDTCSQLDRVNLVDLACQAVGITDATDLLKWVAELVDEEGADSDGEAAEHAAILTGVDALKGGDAKEAGELAGRVGAAPGLSATQRAKLLDDIAERAGAGKRAILKDAKAGAAAASKARQASGAGRNDGLEAIMREWNKKYAVVLAGEGASVLMEPARPGGEPRFVSERGFKSLMAPKKVTVTDAGGGNEEKAICDLWWHWKDRRTCLDGLVFEPDGCGPNAYNLWRGFPVKPKAGNWDLLRTHVLENVCQGDEGSFTWLMTWLAQMFQQPGKKLGSAVAIKGEKGTGKSKLFDWVRAAMGQHAVKVTSAKHITGNFNAHHAGKILMVCEEALWAGDRAALGTLKDLITSSTSLLERKGVDPVEVSNFARLAFTSNEKWVVPVQGEDERRFFVLECGVKQMQNIPYFVAIDEQMESGGLEAMVAELTAWTPPKGGWNVLRTPPKGEAHKSQALAGLGEVGPILVRLAMGEIVPKKGRSVLDGDKVRLELGKDKAGADCCILDKQDLVLVLESHFHGRAVPDDRQIMQALRLAFGEVESTQARIDKDSHRRVYRILHSSKDLKERMVKQGWAEADIKEQD